MRHINKSYWQVPGGEVQYGHISRTLTLWWGRRRWTVKLQPLAYIAIIAAVLATLVYGCGEDAEADPWDGQGVVTNLVYDDEDEWTSNGACINYVKIGEVRSCVQYHRVEHHDPPHWYVVITDVDGREHRVEVPEVGYSRCRLGAIWNNATRGCPS